MFICMMAESRWSVLYSYVFLMFNPLLITGPTMGTVKPRTVNDSENGGILLKIAVIPKS